MLSESTSGIRLRTRDWKISRYSSGPASAKSASVNVNGRPVLSSNSAETLRRCALVVVLCSAIAANSSSDRE
jgi:hypothetical protein